MEFEFDPVKEQANLQKHGVSFSEASTCLLDPVARVREDGARKEDSGLSCWA